MKHCPNPECSFRKDTGRAGEYRDDISVCTDCGASLALGEPPAVPATTHDVRWVGVRLASDAHEVHLATSALAREGIPAQTRGVAAESAGVVLGQPSMAEIIVPAPFAEAAAQILETHLTEAVPLPEGEDLEFVDAEGVPIDIEEDLARDSPDAPAAESFPAAPEGGAGALRPPASMPDVDPEPAHPRSCPRCESSGVTRLPPPSPAERRGLFARLFGSSPDWTCLQCGHRWS
ncbi:MAG: hypothetical protein ACE5IK_06870 [Acidobacteriota bacterium]